MNLDPAYSACTGKQLLLRKWRWRHTKCEIKYPELVFGATLPSRLMNMQVMRPRAQSMASGIMCSHRSHHQGVVEGRELEGLPSRILQHVIKDQRHGRYVVIAHPSIWIIRVCSAKGCLFSACFYVCNAEFNTLQRQASDSLKAFMSRQQSLLTR